MPGVFDGMTAWLAQKAGFKAIFLSGAAVSASQLACPDIGLTTVTELASTLEHIRLRTNAAILVDADSGRKPTLMRSIYSKTMNVRFLAESGRPYLRKYCANCRHGLGFLEPGEFPYSLAFLAYTAPT